ncbi:MAG: HRDC domain-containing protein [bacterium]
MTDADANGADASGPDVRGADPDQTEPRLVAVPRASVNGPITDPAALVDAVTTLAAGSGPLAVDAERASGYRYSQRAYLIQLARAGAGIVLIDPIAVPLLDLLQEALGDVEWVLHAASQDLGCLREVGLDPQRLFDTETAGRLLGLERVSLSAMLETFLGVRLEKGYSAADWSTRPLPSDWLVYAALDVDLLVELRDAVAAELDRTGKRAWAEQEFAATLAAPPAAARVDPWRRTSGIHQLRSRRQLAMVRAMWNARDEMARARDIAPGRILPDSAVVAAVRADPSSPAALSQLPVFRGPRQRRSVPRWFSVLQAARTLPDSELPSPAPRGETIPAPSRWRERDPEAAARLAAVRAVVSALAGVHSVQAQNLLAADVVRRLSWQPPPALDDASVAAALADLGARPWQIELCALGLATALRELAEPLDPELAEDDA